MAFDSLRARPLVQRGDLRTLFVEELGWDPSRQQVALEVGERTYSLSGLAQKKGFTVWLCGAPGNDLPDHKTRLKLDRKLSETSFEHLVVFVNEDKSHQSWSWVRRERGKPLTARSHEFHRGESGDALLDKLRRLYVSLEEEEAGISTIAIAGRARAAFDLDRVTKSFYREFDGHRKSFLKLIDGIDSATDREWYTSVMLNRLMFVYFIQRRGFLDSDPDYLRNRLKVCQREKGKDKFYSFYRYFLLRLFHEGFSTRRRSRAAGLERLLGNIPYLNGGLFDVHELERPERYGGAIQIPDKAFEKILDFFDGWDWVLDPDHRAPGRNSEGAQQPKDEINPDVLGYIFEQYINQKQMGAYYTKEDITEYIGKSTIVPHILERARAMCEVAFTNESGGTVWDLLREDPDRYIYPSVRFGLSEAPERDAGGVTAEEEGAEADRLPLETVRERAARKARYLTQKSALAAGKIRELGDLITFNLDIRQFAQDIVATSEGPELVRAVWQALSKVSILDPTCGSGAFLFAALNILEPLYDACLERMALLVEEDDRLRQARSAVGAGAAAHALRYEDFRELLAAVAKHSSARYFILKSIVLNNLFGVDIMEEAVEICKLRLFLKLAAHVDPDPGDDNLGIEPLPDIDFNVRAGNALVGFARAEEVRRKLTSDATDELDQMRLSVLGEGGAYSAFEARLREVDAAFRTFRRNQAEVDGAPSLEAKAELKKQLRALENQLNKLLAADSAVSAEDKARYANWLASRQPFHWFIQFHEIIAAGGFDVIIGNPPYVATAKVDYLSEASKALKLPDLYAHVTLRVLSLASNQGRCGLIVPLSLTFSGDFAQLRRALMEFGRGWYSSYDNIPAALFAGVSQRCTIWIADRVTKDTLVTEMYRWRSGSRPSLMECIAYARPETGDLVVGGVPKLSSAGLATLFKQLQGEPGRNGRIITMSGRHSRHSVGYSTTARNFVSAFKEAPPYLDEETLESAGPALVGEVAVVHPDDVFAAIAAFIGELYFWYWLTRGDGFHVTSGILSEFLRCVGRATDDDFALLVDLGKVAAARRNEALVFKKNAGKYVGNLNYRGHAWLTRRADLVLLASAGASRAAAEELFAHIQRVLGINQFAGEKSIPGAVKAKFRPKKPDEQFERDLFARTDRRIRKHFGFSTAELNFLLNKDVVYRPWGEGAEED